VAREVAAIAKIATRTVLRLTALLLLLLLLLAATAAAGAAAAVAVTPWLLLLS
jgi:hypothetical protein